MTRPCTDCGVALAGAYPTRRYCPPCAAARNRTARRDNQRRWRARGGKPTRKTIGCRDCGTPFDWTATGPGRPPARCQDCRP